MGRLIKALATGCLAIALQHISFSACAAAEDFPVPVSLQPAVEFWVKVYTEISTSEGYLHDSRNLAVIYEVLDTPAKASPRTRRRTIDRARKRYQGILRTLAKGKRDGLSAEQMRVLALWPEDVSNSELKKAAGRLRFQLGQSDRFREGILRSGTWLPYIHRVIAEHGLPQELAYLPHVESSFNPMAHSHASAVGIWQFTRGTGRQFMRIDHVVDERLDPFVSTQAAARLLKSNLEATGSWPLAVTAYNHGTAGMRRAARKLGTRDIGEVVKSYKSKTFGFASRNFYASFRAAVRVVQNASVHFGHLEVAQPAHYEVTTVGIFASARTIADALNVDLRELKRYNPALKQAVWNGDKYVPRDYPLRVPAPYSAPEALAAFAQVDQTLQHKRQKPDLMHKVRKGETVSQIASRYGVSSSSLVALNGLRSKHKIRVGQTLRLPRTADSPALITKPARVSKVALAPTPTVTASTTARVSAGASGVQVKSGGITGTTYRVRNGDTLSVIADSFEITQRALVAANGLRSRHRIYKGQVLIIPSDLHAGALPQTYEVRNGDTLSLVAARFGMSERELASINDIRNKHRIYAGQVLKLKPPQATL